MNKTFLLALSLLLSITTLVSAQKFGFCYSALLMTQLPEVKAADSDLQAFQTQLTKVGQQRVKNLQDKAADLKSKQDRGAISPKDGETQTALLQAEQESIADYEQEVYSKLAQKRQELYKPIFDKVNEAMKVVAAENGFQFVFDSSTQVVLYGHESLDVTSLLKVKLGLN